MRILLFISMLALLSCQSAKHSNPEEAKQAIQEILDTQVDAWNAGDIDGFMAGYENSENLRFASGGNVTYGWQITLDRYKKGYPDKATMGKLIFSEIDIKLISKDAALVFGKWELERASDHPWGLFTLLFKKTADGWRVVHDHTSSAKK